MSSAIGNNEVAVVLPDVKSPPEEVKIPIQLLRPMKIMDKIVDYQQKQQQKQTQEPSSSSPPLPAVSLEFFPPKSPDGVLVSPFWIVSFFQFGRSDSDYCCCCCCECSSLSSMSPSFSITTYRSIHHRYIYIYIYTEPLRTHRSTARYDWDGSIALL
jgi:hypothetical protein